jgi:NitT/TauT family transport system substrate-binding protein
VLGACHRRRCAIANSTTGADDVFWYVPVASDDQEHQGKPTARRSPIPRRASVHQPHRARLQPRIRDPGETGGDRRRRLDVQADDGGQVDIGWSAPPFGVAALQQGRIRIVGRQGDLAAYRDQTVRLMIATPALVEQRRAAVDRFLQAYRETLDWMYADPAAIKAYAKWAGVSEAVAKALRDRFYP